MVTNDWCQWFAGFVDGEGCFVVEGGVAGYTPRFSIVLRDDDRAVLEEVQEVLGTGSITLMSNAARRSAGTSNGADCFQYRVHGVNCALVVAALDGRLRSKKEAELQIWKQAVELRIRVPRCIGDDALEMKRLREALQVAKRRKEIDHV